MAANKPATPAPPSIQDVREDRVLTPRISPALHSAIVATADRFHTSINSICTMAFEKYLTELVPPLWPPEGGVKKLPPWMRNRRPS
jgi:hypothetical protein